MITLQQARDLQIGDILVDENKKRWKVNGRVTTWKTMPDRIRVPLKHGLYSYDSITESDFTDGFCNQLTKLELSRETYYVYSKKLLAKNYIGKVFRASKVELERAFPSVEFYSNCAVLHSDYDIQRARATAFINL